MPCGVGRRLEGRGRKNESTNFWPPLGLPGGAGKDTAWKCAGSASGGEFVRPERFKMRRGGDREYIDSPPPVGVCANRRSVLEVTPSLTGSSGSGAFSRPDCPQRWSCPGEGVHSRASATSVAPSHLSCARGLRRRQRRHPVTVVRTGREGGERASPRSFIDSKAKIFIQYRGKV